MLRVEGRAAEGVRGILRALSAMAEDAIGDDGGADNAFMGVRLRGDDPRIRKPARPVRVWSFEQMRAFAAGGRAEMRAATKRPLDSRNRTRRPAKPRHYSPHNYEALLLTPALTGLRLGEFLALRREDFDGEVLDFRFSAHNGELIESSKQKNHQRTLPVPPSPAALLVAQLESHDSELIFPTPRGKLSASATSTATFGPRRSSPRPGPHAARVPPLLRHSPARCGDRRPTLPRSLATGSRR